MTHTNPYVQNLIEMGYDENDCKTPSTQKKFPLNIHGRIFHTQEQYNEALHDYFNGL